MIVRPAIPADYDQWLPLWKGYQAFYATDIPQAVTDATWSRFHNPAEPMHCAVADLDGKLVGTVHYIYHRSCWTSGDYCYLQDLFTDESQRGKGIGRALIEFVYATAQAAGASRVYWVTQDTNAQAMLLYDRMADKTNFVQYRKLFK